MRVRPGAAGAGAVTLALAAALLGAPQEAEAKGGRRIGGGGSVGRSAPHADRDGHGPIPGGGTHLTIRPGSSSGGSSANAVPVPVPGRIRAVLPGAAPAVEAPPDPEELARRAAALSSYERAMADNAAAHQAAAERAEQLRLQAEKLEAQRAAQRTAEEKAEAARLAAAAEQKKRQQDALQSEVDQVLERARNDFPLLRTPEGEPILRAIQERQKVLQAGGMYPSIAMVEAVADHAEALRPRTRERVQASAQSEAAPDYSRTYGNCRWLTPYTWSCK